MGDYGQTPKEASFFIHANDAGHGSLGAIEKNDIVILISYSGETEETFSIINFCKRRKRHFLH